MLVFTGQHFNIFFKVDEEFNITGILDFPGTVVPLPSLCASPWMFNANYLEPIVDRDAYFNTFISRESHCPVSLLHLPEIRKKIDGFF